jgi:hypothetical protein
MRNTTCLIGNRVWSASTCASVAEPPEVRSADAGAGARVDGVALADAGPLVCVGDGAPPSGVEEHATARKSVTKRPAESERRRSVDTAERRDVME